MPTRSKPILALACLIPLVACGGGGADRAGDMAKALDNSKDTVPKEAQAARLKELKAKAEEKSKQAHADELQKITSLVQPLPADLETACADAGAGLDAFMQKRLVGDELGRWNAIKEPDTRKVVEECKAGGKLEVGACIGKAFREASVGEFANGAQGEIKAECTKRFGGAAALAPAKRSP